MSTLTPRVEAWRNAGELVDIDGQSIFVHHRDGDGPPLLFLHGYPSSSYDWRHVLDLLPGRRIVCFDFLGFGLSAKPRDHLYSLHGQADLVEAVWRRYVSEPVVLIAHDMGTSVTTELLARDLEQRLEMDLRAVLLFNGSMILEAASLTPAQKVLRSRFGPLLARLSSERFFRAQFARIFSRAHPLTPEEAADQWALLAHDDGHRIVDRLTYYLHERVRFAPRWHGALRDWAGRLELAWALRDPVATTNVLDAVLALRPHAPVTRWEELGHYPQIEDPQAVARVTQRVADQPAPARSAS
jgi:pimeloyl-ACP methyl ester carboxylesterase